MRYPYHTSKQEKEQSFISYEENRYYLQQEI